MKSSVAAIIYAENTSCMYVLNLSYITFMLLLATHICQYLYIFRYKCVSIMKFNLKLIIS